MDICLVKVKPGRDLEIEVVDESPAIRPRGSLRVEGKPGDP
jgi:hypothetical protein